MNNTKLTNRKSELEARASELLKQHEDIDKQIQKLIGDKNTTVANYNAVNGALLLLQELLEDAASDCECGNNVECLPTTGQ